MKFGHADQTGQLAQRERLGEMEIDMVMHPAQGDHAPTVRWTTVTIGVLALQGDVREHVRALESGGASAVPVRRAGELDAVDALVIPGGESTTMSNLAVAFGLLDPIRKRITGGMPVYGSCAGMIMLAGTVLDGRPDQESFGGIDMTVRRNAFGRQVDSFEAPVEIAGIDGEPFHAVFIRAPWVEEVGSGVEVMGRVTDGPAAGRVVAVRQGNLLATAFHPELTGDLRVHRYFVEMVRRGM
jgi:pyridoxal 5'-phosphate synthase pdxT subunit